LDRGMAVHGKVRRGEARCGQARIKAEPCRAWLGKEHGMARQSVVRLGIAWLGGAEHGKEHVAARRGEARQG